MIMWTSPARRSEWGNWRQSWKEKSSLCMIWSRTQFIKLPTIWNFPTGSWGNMPIARSEMTSVPTVWPVGTEPMSSKEKDEASSGTTGAGERKLPTAQRWEETTTEQLERFERQGFRRETLTFETSVSWELGHVYDVDPRISHTRVKTDVFFKSSPCICYNVR